MESGWAPYCDFTDEEVKKGISLLDKKITILSVSEFGSHLDENNKYEVGEYSISHGEPCLETISNLNYAKSLKRSIMAKIQVNNSWEMSSIPYIPVYECIIDHLKKLDGLSVKDLMASWTLGGYPSLSLALTSTYDSNFNYDSWLKSIYKSDYQVIKEAVHLFSNGFKNFPFDINTLYFSSLHLGPANPLFMNKSDYKATMVTFPYDDISSWLDNNKSEEIINSFKILLKSWKKGLNKLKDIKDNKINNQLKAMSEVFYINVSSFVDQYLFYKGKLDRHIFLKSELKRVVILYQIASKYAEVGFEASNHYLYTQNNFLEKIISIKLNK